MEQLKVYTFSEVQELKKQHYNFSMVCFKSEYTSEYKIYYRNEYLENVIIDFREAE